MFSTRLGAVIELLPKAGELLLMLELDLLLLLMFWLKSCHGTGIILPVVVEPEALLGVPTVLERLVGVVSRPEVEVSDAPPADESERIANCTRPLCGSTVKSRMCPRVFPSCDWTAPFMSWLIRTFWPELIELLEP